MRRKITPELLKQMKQDRIQGATYKQIEQKYNVSRWVTIHYLKNIEIKQSVVDTLWKQAEKKAAEYLKENNYTRIIDLNKICPQSFFDYYAEKEKDKWLIDVTINESKDLVAKSLKLVGGYRCAILYVDHSLQNFKLVELKEVKTNGGSPEKSEKDLWPIIKSQTIARRMNTMPNSFRLKDSLSKKNAQILKKYFK